MRLPIHVVGPDGFPYIRYFSSPLFIYFIIITLFLYYYFRWYLPVPIGISGGFVHLEGEHEKQIHK